MARRISVLSLTRPRLSSMLKAMESIRKGLYVVVLCEG